MIKKTKLISELSWRGILREIANEENLEDIINKQKSFYIGIDPTAESLHLGHYSSIIVSKLISDLTNMKAIFVLGGLSGQIGDPSGKNSERELISEEKILKNSFAIKKQITALVKNLDFKNYDFFNNNDIYKNMSITQFFKEYGKNFNLNTMLKKESVQNRIETGISYTEFSYQVFQAIDFLFLYKNKNVAMQIGGSDQWGNITAGIDLIKKIIGAKEKLVGITISLLLDEQGNKLGKTSGNPIWLNKELFSPYRLFQYLINLSDQSVINLLPKLTLITENEFQKLLLEHQKLPIKKILQFKLTELLTIAIHSKEEYEISKNLSEILFSENYAQISESELRELKKLIKNLAIAFEGLQEFILKHNLLSSKREYREFINDQAIKINNKVISDPEYLLSKEDLINNKFLILSLGKKQKILLENKRTD